MEELSFRRAAGPWNTAIPGAHREVSSVIALGPRHWEMLALEEAAKALGVCRAFVERRRRPRSPQRSDASGVALPENLICSSGAGGFCQFGKIFAGAGHNGSFRPDRRFAPGTFGSCVPFSLAGKAASVRASIRMMDVPPNYRGQSDGHEEHQPIGDPQAVGHARVLRTRAWQLSAKGMASPRCKREHTFVSQPQAPMNARVCDTLTWGLCGRTARARGGPLRECGCIIGRHGPPDRWSVSSSPLLGGMESTGVLGSGLNSASVFSWWRSL